MSDLHVSFTSYDHANFIRAEQRRLVTTYNVGERQMWHTYQIAAHQPGDPGENLLILLECRLENLVYRAGFTPDRETARQIITRHHILVDGRGVSVPSYRVQPGQRIDVRTRNVQPLMLLRHSRKPETPPYLETCFNTLCAILICLPRRDEIPCDVDESLIMQYYSVKH
jgi:small subunit ribosomal protein S4